MASKRQSDGFAKILFKSGWMRHLDGRWSYGQSRRRCSFYEACVVAELIKLVGVRYTKTYDGRCTDDLSSRAVAKYQKHIGTKTQLSDNLTLSELVSRQRSGKKKKKQSIRGRRVIKRKIIKMSTAAGPVGTSRGI